MKKILLLTSDPLPKPLAPLGVNYIAENLALHGFDVKVIDIAFENRIQVKDYDMVGVSVFS